MAPPQWAYQVENFVNEPDEEFICSICRAIFCDPVVCPCDHVFCRVCITKWLQNNRNCPICRKRASNSSVKQMIPIIKNLIMKLVLYCRNKTLGCKAQFSLESCEAHMKECQYEFVQCKNKPCKDKLFRKDIAEHETSDCPHRYIKCQKCGSKMLTSELPENHDCIKSLQLRIRKKSLLLRKKNNRLKELKNEIKALKTASQNPRRAFLTRSQLNNFGHTLSSSTLGDLSPDEIMINITELESSSLSSDSDDSSENSIIIFANSPADHSDDNAESESFSTYNQDSIEISRNESFQDASEYRHAESQTADDLSANEQVNDSHYEESPTYDNDSIVVEAPDSLYDESENRSYQRPNKRRPTTQKPAKRKITPATPASSTDDDSDFACSTRSSKRCWRQPPAESDKRNSEGSHMEAGPSSASASLPVGDSACDTSPNTKWHFRSKPKTDRKLIKEGSNVNSRPTILNSQAIVPSGNAVFERTLALLEQYNLESDPEWLPEYASHRGNDTTTESDSSIEAEYLNSTSSDLSDSNDDSNANGDDFRHDSMASGFMHWIFDSTSEEDPDWQPY